MSYKFLALSLLSICAVQNIYSASQGSEVFNTYNNTPLHQAIQQSSYEEIFHLIDKQQNYINIKNDLGYTPLHLAVCMPDEGSIVLNIKEHPLSLEKLLTYLGYSAEFSYYCFHQRFLSHISISCLSLKYTIIKQLLRQKSDPNSYNSFNNTPLHDAVRNNDPEAVLLLLYYKAYIHILDSINNTPLHLAAYLGHKKIVEVLLQKGANTKLRNAASFLPLDLIALRGSPEVKALL